MKKTALYIMCVFLLFIGTGCGGININYKCPNQTPLDTTAFVDRPEEMVMITKGRQKSCSDEQINVFYEKLEVSLNDLKFVTVVKTLLRQSHIRKFKRNETCLELRYYQRRKLNYHIYLEDANWSAVEYRFEDTLFDALLLVFDADNSFFFLTYLENKYTGQLLVLESESIPDLKTYLAEEIEKW